MISPLKEKKNRLLEKSLERVKAIHSLTGQKTKRWGWIRFSVFMAGLVLLLAAFEEGNSLFAIAAASVFVPAFIAVSIIQGKVIAVYERQKVWIEIKKSHLARLNLDWEGIPGHRVFENRESSYLEADLDITGSRSLHQLIDYTKSKEGSALLREFLIAHPADTGIIKRRQEIVKELNANSRFREKFLLCLSGSSKKELSSAPLLNWIAGIDKSNSIKRVLKFLIPLYIFNILLIAGIIGGAIPVQWGGLVLISVLINFLNQGKIAKTISSGEAIGERLKEFAGIIGFIEKGNYKRGGELFALVQPVTGNRISPTKEIASISSGIETIAMRNNPLVFMLFLVLFPLDYIMAARVEKKKNNIAGHLNEWLETVHKLEVFVSLSLFSVLNPEYSFPEIKSSEQNHSLKMEEAGHPLIHAKKKVCNNFEISVSGKQHLITGSNMSGKSTFLRTIGINICLGYAGAPVNAALFNFVPVRLFTCIKVSDSVIDGISYFYAEVKRLKQLLGEIEENSGPPVIYLIDEIFKGTNNIERLKGSESLIKYLSDKSGSGLISTHDLELVKLSSSLRSLENYHFKEEIIEGQMRFDYKIHTGPCPTTNALIIMKENGLPVE